MKEKLLATNIFINNNYFEDYLRLLAKSSSLSTYSEWHHAIPVCYYKERNKITTTKHRHSAERCADADPNNTKVLLNFADHCKAHWLLTKCLIDPYAKMSGSAFLKMVAAITDDLCIARKTGLISQGLSADEYESLQKLIEEVKFNNDRFWKSEEDQWLINNFRNFSVAQCAEHLGRTESAVRNRAVILNLKHIGWLPDMDAQLTDLYINQNKTAEECAKIFNMSKANIVKRCRELGLKKAKQWTKEEDNFIINNDSKLTVAAMAKVLGVSKTTLMGRRWTLNITKWDRDNNKE